MSRDSKYLFSLTLLYFTVSFIGIRHHELWLDEAHHWLLARDSVSFPDLIKNTKSEGHPILWDALLYGITRLTVNPFWMQLLHISIATLAVFVFLQKAPFSWWFKTLFIFGYFMIFEYDLISRNYILGVLFLFLACNAFRNRNKNFIWLCLFLALASNVHLMFAVIALALFLTVGLEHIQSKQFFKKPDFILGSGIFFLGLLPLALQIHSPENQWFFDSIDTIPLADKFTKGFISLFKGMVTVPDFTTIHFWNSNLLVNFSKPVSAFFGLILYALPLFLFFKKRMILFFVYVALLGAQIFFFITQRGATRFDGITFLIIIIALWIEHYFEDRNFTHFNPLLLVLAKKPVVYGILFLQFCSGWYAYSMDLVHPFTESKQTVDYLKEKHLDNFEIVSVTCDATALSPYLGKKIYFLCDGSYQSYCHWDFSCATNITQNHIQMLLQDYMKKRNYAVYVSNYPIVKSVPNVWKNIGGQVKVRFLKKFDQAIIRDAYYYVFEVSKI